MSLIFEDRLLIIRSKIILFSFTFIFSKTLFRLTSVFQRRIGRKLDPSNWFVAVDLACEVTTDEGLRLNPLKVDIFKIFTKND